MQDTPEIDPSMPLTFRRIVFVQDRLDERPHIIGNFPVGTPHLRAWMLALLAEAYGHTGRVEEGLAALAEALTIVGTTGGKEEAELYRLKGELLGHARYRLEEAEACLSHALTRARRQQAKSWELRAALSLSRLWQGQRRRKKAQQLLTPIYNWFTEGFDTADPQEAKALLEELS